MSAGLDSALKQLATGKNFATLTTLNRTGAPSTQVVWIDADDEYLLVNTEVHRFKYTNAKNDPRVAVMIWVVDDPLKYIEVRGRIVGEYRGLEAREHIDELSRRYTGQPFTKPIVSERVTLQIAPDRVVYKGVEHREGVRAKGE